MKKPRACDRSYVCALLATAASLEMHLNASRLFFFFSIFFFFFSIFFSFHLTVVSLSTVAVSGVCVSSSPIYTLPFLPLSPRSLHIFIFRISLSLSIALRLSTWWLIHTHTVVQGHLAVVRQTIETFRQVSSVAAICFNPHQRTATSVFCFCSCCCRCWSYDVKWGLSFWKRLMWLEREREREKKTWLNLAIAPTPPTTTAYFSLLFFCCNFFLWLSSCVYAFHVVIFSFFLFFFIRFFFFLSFLGLSLRLSLSLSLSVFPPLILPP